MHDGMPYGWNQGQGHSREVDRQSPTGLIFIIIITINWFAPCRLRGCQNKPALFPGRMSYKVTKLGLVCILYLSIIAYYGSFLFFVTYVSMCSVFWLF